MKGGVSCCFVLVGALLVRRGVGELDASTDVVVVVAPNLVRDPLSHPCRLQRHALVRVLSRRRSGPEAELSPDVDDQAVRGGVELAAAAGGVYIPIFEGLGCLA